MPFLQGWSQPPPASPETRVMLQIFPRNVLVNTNVFCCGSNQPLKVYGLTIGVVLTKQTVGLDMNMFCWLHVCSSFFVITIKM